MPIDLLAIINDKHFNAKTQSALISHWLLCCKLPISEIIAMAQATRDVNKAACYTFVSGALTEKAPWAKREPAM